MSNIATISHVELVNFFSCAKPISPCSHSVIVSAGKKKQPRPQQQLAGKEFTWLERFIER